MLILDEVNYILGSRYVKHHEAMEAIKHVSNESKVSVVLVGTPETKQLTQISFQYFRRFPRVELRRFEACNEEFCQLLCSIEEQISPPVPLGLGDPKTHLPEVLHEMSGGLLGALTPILQTAYRALLHQYDVDGLRDPMKFIEMLEAAQNTILGDDGKAFMERLLKSERDHRS